MYIGNIFLLLIFVTIIFTIHIFLKCFVIFTSTLNLSLVYKKEKSIIMKYKKKSSFGICGLDVKFTCTNNMSSNRTSIYFTCTIPICQLIWQILASINLKTVCYGIHCKILPKYLQQLIKQMYLLYNGSTEIRSIISKLVHLIKLLYMHYIKNKLQYFLIWHKYASSHIYF